MSISTVDKVGLSTVDKICLIPIVGNAIGIVTIARQILPIGYDVVKMAFAKFGEFQASRNIFMRDKKFDSIESFDEAKADLADRINWLGIGILRFLSPIGSFIRYIYVPNRTAAALELLNAGGIAFMKHAPALSGVLNWGRQLKQPLTAEMVQDHKDAFDLYMKAAKMGSIDAQLRIGQMFMDNEGIDEKYSACDRCEQALYWLHKAAFRGDCRAMLSLGTLFYNRYHLESFGTSGAPLDLSLERSQEKGVEWLKRALAAAELELLKNKTTPSDQNYNVEKEKACKLLAYAYKNGYGVPQSDEEAEKYAKKQMQADL